MEKNSQGSIPLLEVTAEELRAILTESIEKLPFQPIMIWGGFGIGKTQIVEQIIADKKYSYKHTFLSSYDPTDLKGYGIIKGDKTTFLPPDELPDKNDKTNGVLFLDELSNAMPAVQHITYRLFQQRSIGTYTLPQGWRIIGAGNRQEDGGAVFKMLLPLGNRMTHFVLKPEFDVWKKWALTHDIHPLVIGFLNFRPELLNKIDTHSPINATPRSWEFTSNALHKLNLDDITMLKVINGNIGQGPGGEFYSFMKVYKELPDPEDILLKDKNLVPKESNQLYAITSALVSLVQKHPKKISRLITYSLKLPKEFSVLMVKDLLKTTLKPLVWKDKEFDGWVKYHSDIILT